jgi:NADPH:quinone reductase-like Zn-dependent oxidoreductase
VYGVTNKNFTGAQPEFALAKASMTARKPATFDFLGAASVPVVAVTAWQMVHQHASLTRGQRVLVLGANGNVGRYAVQLAARAGAHVIAAKIGELIKASVLSTKVGTVLPLEEARTAHLTLEGQSRELRKGSARD